RWNSNTTSWQTADYWIETNNNEPDWAVAINTNAWTDTHQYRIRIKAKDKAGNWRYGTVQYTYFYYDETEPASGITVPEDNKYYASGLPAALTGTSIDAGSGVNKVEIQVKRHSDGYYLSGSDQKFYGTPEWINVGVTPGPNPPWTYGIDYPTAAWSNGVEYLVLSRATDKATNEQSVFGVGVSSNTFVYDTSLPDSGITNPAGDTNSPPQLMGTCSDTAPGVVAEVRYRLRTQGSKYWNELGPGWGEAGIEYWNTATLSSGATAWWETVSVWYDEITYSLNSRAKDDAGNWELNFSTRSFTYDSVKPVSVSTTPYSAAYKYLAYIGGTASDGDFGSGITEVRLEVTDISADTTYYWNGPEPKWQAATPAWLPVTGLTEWSYADILDTHWRIRGTGHRFRIRTKAKDFSGNEEIASAGFEFVYDTSTPVSVSTGPVNNTSYSFMGGQVILAGTAKDEPNLSLPRAGNAGLNVVNISLKDKSNSNCWTGSSWTATSPYWITATGKANWTYAVSTANLTSDRDYELRSRAKDNVSLFETNITTRVFTFDNIPPVSAVSVPAAQWYGNNLTQFSGSVNDTKTGVDRVDLWLKWESTSPVKYYNGSAWTSEDWFNTGSDVWTYAISTPAFKSGHQYKIKSRGVDNTEQSANFENGELKSQTTFYFDNVKPVTVVLYPADSGKYTIINKILGTASDDPGGIYQYEALMKVTDIALRNVTLGKWWDGVGTGTSSFSSDVAVWKGTTSWSAPNWEVSIPTTIFTSGHSYLVRS
ncbi:hypothetical protein KJ959_09180, partial [bacterium]|nr:hypothetical protein [bacterium]